MNNVQQIIKNNNITPKWFITIKFIETQSFTLSRGEAKLNIKSDNTNITKVEKSINYFINLLYQAVYGKTSTKKIREKKFQILTFIERGESNYSYHAHLITEDMPIEYFEIENILKRIQLKHKGISTKDSQYTKAIDLRPYQYYHTSYVTKAETPRFIPFSILTSRINTNGQH